MAYQQTEGKFGPIYQIGEGLRVVLNEWGSWEVLLNNGGQRKRRAIGKGDENYQKALRVAEMLAVKLGIPLEREGVSRTFRLLVSRHICWFHRGQKRGQTGANA